MAKADLVHNEDFRAYTEDLVKRREDAYKRLDSLLGKPDYAPEWSAMLFCQRAIIKEYDLILSIPEEYLLRAAGEFEQTEQEIAAEAMKSQAQRLRGSMLRVKLDSLKRVLSGR